MFASGWHILYLSSYRWGTGGCSGTSTRWSDRSPWSGGNLFWYMIPGSPTIGQDFLPDFDASADFLSTLSLFSTLPGKNSTLWGSWFDTSIILFLLVSTLFGKLCSLNHDRISFHHNNRREHCILSTSFCFRYHLHWICAGNSLPGRLLKISSGYVQTS